MRPESLKYLYDGLQAADVIDEMCAGETYGQYAENIMFRSAVERQFEIAGEALSQLGKLDSETFERVPDARQIVSFRNFLIHNEVCVARYKRRAQAVIQGWPEGQMI